MYVIKIKDERQYSQAKLIALDRTMQRRQEIAAIKLTLMSGEYFHFRVQREICARSAGTGLHPGAAEHPGLFKYHWLPVRLLRARQPDAACHVDYQPGSEIGYGSSGTQVNHVS